VIEQRILVTGASGFIGCALCSQLLARGLSVCGITRSLRKFPAGIQSMTVGEIDDTTDWQDALAGCSIVIHLAARAHVMAETAENPIAEFRRINMDGTLNLARQAAKHGVRRFIFISSIGVNGAETFARPFSAGDLAAPHSPYAISKHEAELALKALAVETGLEVVIVRPPLVYGPGAPGNFSAMMRWLRRGVPLPLGAIHNQRSLVALDNLVDLIITCLTHPAAANQTFLVSDGQDVSTTELLRRMGKAMNCPAHLIPVPAGLLMQAAALLGKRDMAQRLCGSLQVDIQKTRQLLGWNPPLTLDQGLKKAAKGLAP
jgi:nucleoside-diphosphate-sugar epimerase